MSDTPRLPSDLRRGQRFGNKIPIDAINAGIEAKRALLGGPMLEKARRLSGGGGGGGTLTPVMVYDNLVGGTVDSDGVVTQGAAARCLPVIASDVGWAANLDAEFLDLKVWSLASLSLDETGCCGDEETGPVPTGIRISDTLGAGSDGRVYDSDGNSGAVIVSGTGVPSGASITVSITDGTTTLTPTATNNGDGTWQAASQSLSSLNKGVVKVTATDGAVTDALVITYSADDSGPELAHFTGRAPTPDMTSATDLGVSSVDNVTSDLTPTFACAHGSTSPVDAGGPIPRLYIKGVLVASGTLTSYDTSDPVVSSVDLTPGSDLDLGKQRAQLVLEWTDSSETFWGPPSPSLLIDINEDAVEETEPEKRYARLGMVANVATLGDCIVSIDKCRREITADEIEKLDA